MMTRFDLLSLQMLLFVAETGSVSKAAEKSNLTVSAVSKRLLELEAQLGVVLFDRLPQGVRLTPAGSAAVQRINEVMPIFGKLQVDLQAYVKGDAGIVHIASNTSGIAAGLARELESFKAQYPQVDLRLEELTSAHVIEAVAEGRADLGICAASAPLSSLASSPYHATPLVLAVPADHPLTGRGSVTYQESLAYPHIGRTQDSALAWLPPGTEAAPVSPSISTLVTSFAAVLALVRAGTGVAVIPIVALKNDSLGGIQIVELSDAWMTMELIVVFDPLRVLPPAVSRVRAHLVASTDKARIGGF